MTQGDRRPERFEKGQRLSAAALNTLVDSVLSILNRRIGGGIHKPPNMLVVLDEDLVAAVDWKNNPSIADAHVAERRASGNYEVTTRTVVVVNRFENISLDAGTLVGIEWIDGEWQPYKADCLPESNASIGLSASVPSPTPGTGGI